VGLVVVVVRVVGDPDGAVRDGRRHGRAPPALLQDGPRGRVEPLQLAGVVLLLDLQADSSPPGFLIASSPCSAMATPRPCDRRYRVREEQSRGGRRAAAVALAGRPGAVLVAASS
jgi:hypothetical protein